MTKAILVSAIVLSTASVAFAQSEGEAIYKAKCQMCHGATGNGDSPAGRTMKVKPFSDPEVTKLSETAMVDIAMNGQNKMPAFKGKLTDDQIKDVVAYIHTLLKK